MTGNSAPSSPSKDRNLACIRWSRSRLLRRVAHRLALKRWLKRKRVISVNVSKHQMIGRRMSARSASSVSNLKKSIRRSKGWRTNIRAVLLHWSRIRTPLNTKRISHRCLSPPIATPRVLSLWMKKKWKRSSVKMNHKIVPNRKRKKRRRTLRLLMTEKSRMIRVKNLATGRSSAVYMSTLWTYV